jgi:hypothetical protein
MRPQEAAAVGVQLRVCEDHRISELRGRVGKVVGRATEEKSSWSWTYASPTDATSYSGPGIQTMLRHPNLGCAAYWAGGRVRTSWPFSPAPGSPMRFLSSTMYAPRSSTYARDVPAD